MGDNLKTVALLPMKANSSRVPGKNFKDFLGKPLFFWILNSLLEVRDIDLVVINTDAREILRSYGLTTSNRVLIRDRPIELCGDEVSMNNVLLNDINAINSNAYLMTHTTNPLLRPNTIRTAITYYYEHVLVSGKDSLFSVNQFQARFYSNQCEPLNHDPANLIPTQNLTPIYEENSCLYMFSKESFLKTKARIGALPDIFVTPKLESIDIDTQEDWDIGEALALFKKIS
jgi:CMP-N-acetylneuraminic acid synthetase